MTVPRSIVDVWTSFLLALCAVTDWLASNPGRRCPPLAVHDVHVWHVALDISAARQAELWRSLSDEERARVERHTTSNGRRRALAARGLTRAVLAGYLELPPAKPAIAVGPRGKPYLVGSSLAFNLTHKDDCALVAVARSDIGVDVERVGSVARAGQIAARYFTAREREELATRSDAAAHLFFRRLWSAKEAYGKARGDGVTTRLADCEIDLDRAPPTIRANDGVAWRLWTLAPSPAFVGAVVAAEASVLAIFRFVE
ncbi:MAG: 4'-phosphopantetheinyl transferase superfamily protein [Chloroflexota bacterium]|nr:MAG: 4'-phosphopantetheinyl transferase superfamily protein [Chloroflexota bacterium]